MEQENMLCRKSRSFGSVCHRARPSRYFRSWKAKIDSFTLWPPSRRAQCYLQIPSGVLQTKQLRAPAAVTCTRRRGETGSELCGLRIRMPGYATSCFCLARATKLKHRFSCSAKLWSDALSSSVDVLEACCAQIEVQGILYVKNIYVPVPYTMLFYFLASGAANTTRCG